MMRPISVRFPWYNAPTDDALAQSEIQRRADVCIIAEGCYPYVSGGVSSWTDWLIRSQPDLQFEVVAILPSAPTCAPKYPSPDNLQRVHHIFLFGETPSSHNQKADGVFSAEAFAEALWALLQTGTRQSLLLVVEQMQRARQRYRSCAAFLNSECAWKAVRIMYERAMPHASFLDYYWGWRAIVGSIYAVLTNPVPPARIYHTLSTGYAGLFAARAALESGAPYLLTEHGIYTNERRIEVLMAPWLNGVLHHGLSPVDDRLDIRDFWINAFEAMAAACYHDASSVITLYRANQDMQRDSGADPWRQIVIPNGIDPSPYLAIEHTADRPPTIAFIGRVAPIKDVKTFIEAAGYIRKARPDLRAYIMGPTDEDPDYARECRALVESMDLAGTIEFTGMVDIKAYLDQIDIVVLTSLSEAQPLTILEAGAAGIPCITTDVGSCRDLLEGVPDENPHFGPGGIVTDLVAPQKIAQAIEILLTDPDQRRAYGKALRERVCTHYRAEDVASRYRELYDNCLATKGEAGS